MNHVIDTLTTVQMNFKYTYLTNREFAKYVDFPFTEEIDNDGKVYFLHEETRFNLLPVYKAKRLMRFIQPTFYLPKTTAYITEDIHVVVRHRHLVLPKDGLKVCVISPDERSIIYEKYDLSKDTRFVAFYPEDKPYCIPLTEEEFDLLDHLRLPIEEFEHKY